MKKILLSIMILAPCLLFSQRTAVENAKYSRSSLHVMMIEDPTMLKKDILINTFETMPFPDKYNSHLLQERSADIIGEVDDLAKLGWPGFKLNGIQEKIESYLQKEKIGNKLVGKWFNRDPNTGVMNMETISLRGLYNATEDDAADASTLEKGFSALERTGLDLIGNTFVVLEYFEFIDNKVWAEPAARGIYELAKTEAMKIENEMARNIALKMAQKTLEKGLEKAQGYSVITNAYLYQLEWNDTIQQSFKSKYWLGDNNKDKFTLEEKQKRVQEFNTTDLFTLKFIGKSRQSSIISNLRKDQGSQNDQIKEITIRSVDKVYLKLQQKYDVFKTKTPFYEIDKKGKKCTAKVGMKEGLTGGEKFDVLIPKYSSKGGTKYSKKGTIKVDKKAVWDNRYYVTRPPELDEDDAIVATSFKGCKKGWNELILLIRQQK